MSGDDGQRPYIIRHSPGETVVCELASDGTYRDLCRIVSTLRRLRAEEVVEALTARKEALNLT